MRSLLLNILAVLVHFALSGQNGLKEEDLIGKWTCRVVKSQSMGTKMALEGSTIVLNKDYSFTAQIMVEFSGQWSFQDERVLLISPDAPEQITLSELSADSCVWDLETMNARVQLYKSSEQMSTILPTGYKAKPGYQEVKRNDLIGTWTNTLIEDLNKSTNENIFLFGTNNDDTLRLFDSGQFSLSKSANTTITGRILKGTWLLENGIIIFNDPSNKIDRLGIAKCDHDSLIIVHLENRFIPMCGETRIRYTHIRSHR